RWFLDVLEVDLSTGVRKRRLKRMLVFTHRLNVLLDALMVKKVKHLNKAAAFWNSTKGKKFPASALFMSREKTRRFFQVYEALAQSLGSLAILACVKTAINWPDYLALVASLPKGRVADLQTSRPTKSGSTIFLLEYRARKGKSQKLVLKSGQAKKVKKELTGIRRWQKLSPDLVANVVNYVEYGPVSSVLLEKMEGQTFEELILNHSQVEFEAALDLLIYVLEKNWTRSVRLGRFHFGFIEQLQERLPAVLSAHPHLGKQKGRLSRSVEKLIAKAGELESNLVCPASVLMHGDLNVDNILVENDANQLHFVDLHRSTHSDYLQDATVLMVSCIRLEQSGKAHGKRVRKVIKEVGRLCDRFALSNHDECHQTRIMLGVARSLITSTRFVQDEKFARKLFARGLSLLKEAVRGHLVDGAFNLNYKKAFYVSV
ncbi:MAG: phosphotransferase, partial [Limnobacter sp.]|nr:phosphotransferase [Limnobacter sp.]